MENSLHRHEARQADRDDIFKSIRNIVLYGFKSIRYSSSKLCNSIPTFIKASVSFNIVESEMNEFLFNGCDLQSITAWEKAACFFFFFFLFVKVKLFIRGFSGSVFLGKTIFCGFHRLLVEGGLSPSFYLLESSSLNKQT